MARFKVELDHLSSGSNRPIMLLLDLMGRKWMLRILWELGKGACTFRELQSRCGDLSPTMVNKRIRELTDAQLVRKNPERGYELTPQAEELTQLFLPLIGWSEQWIKGDSRME